MARKREFILHEHEEIIAYTHVIDSHIIVQVAQGDVGDDGKFKAAEKQGFENYNIEGADYKQIIDQTVVVVDIDVLWEFVDKARSEYKKERE